MLGLEIGFGILVNFVLLSEVDFVNWFLLLALKSIFEAADLIVLIHGEPWYLILVQTSGKLVVSIHVDFFLQLSSHIFVSIIISDIEKC